VDLRQGVPVTDSSGATTLYGNCSTSHRKAEVHLSRPGILWLGFRRDPGRRVPLHVRASFTVEFVSDQIEDLSGYPASDFIGGNVRTYDR